MTKLTIQFVNAQQPGNKPVLVWDDELRGFHLRITPSGVKTYGLFYRANSKQRWLTLGRHGVLTPQQARDLAKVQLGEVAAGGDPAADKRAKREAVSEAEANTFGLVAQRFLAERRRELRGTTFRAYTVVLRNVPKAWQGRPVGHIARKDVVAFLDGLRASDKLAMAKLSVSVLSVFFGWALDHELISIMPTTRIKLPPLKSRERALSISELRRVWAACDALGGVKGALIQMLMLTGQRRNEASLMRWQDLSGLEGNAAVWNIPADVTKNKRPHQVPLAEEAQAIILQQPRIGPHVFTLRGSTPITSTTLDKIKRDIDKLIAKDGQGAIEPWRLHDLRRSLVTGMHEHGLADPHTIELIVNHVGGLRGGIAGVYDRSTRMDARRKALAAWSRLIVNPGDAENVIPLRRRA
jgi:integrase